MRIFMVVTSVVCFLLTAGAVWADQGHGNAPQSGWYISFTPSVLGPFSVDTTSPGLSPAEVKSEWGMGISGGLGYRYGDFRVEGEVLYGRNDGNDISFAGGGGDVTGRYEWSGALINLYYDIPTGVGVRPYVGAGLGGVRFEADDITLAAFPPTNGTSTLFAYNVTAGVTYSLTDSLRLLMGYRLLGMEGPDFQTGGAPLYGKSIHIHGFQVGVQFFF